MLGFKSKESKKQEVRENQVSEIRDLVKNNQGMEMFNLGYSLEKKKWLLIPPSSIIYIGVHGSGKSVNMSSLVFQYYLQNTENTIVFLMDFITGANDYCWMFESPNVYYAFSGEKIVNVIDIAYAEMVKRRDEGNPKGLAVMLLVMENFSTTLNSIFDFDKESEIEGTCSYKLKELIVHGKDFGICFLAAVTEAPSVSLMSLFSEKLIFKSTLESSFKVLGNNKAAHLGRTKDFDFLSYRGNDLLKCYFLSDKDWKGIKNEEK